MNSGLYARAGASATATAAAWANRLEAPITKVSNVYFSFSLVLEVCGCAGAVNGCCEVGGCLPLNVGQISWTAARASPSSSTSSPSDSVGSMGPVVSSGDGTATSGTVTPTGSVGGPSTIGW